MNNKVSPQDPAYPPAPPGFIGAQSQAPLPYGDPKQPPPAYGVYGGATGVPYGGAQYSGGYTYTTNSTVSQYFHNTNIPAKRIPNFKISVNLRKKLIITHIFIEKLPYILTTSYNYNYI